MLRKKQLLLIILTLALAILYYQISDSSINNEVEISRVVDGDTIELENGQKIRLVGINTPEKNMPGYLLAKSFLEKQITNQEVTFEKTGVDRYGRLLGYLHLEDRIINLEILKSGNAHLYYYGKDSYYNQMKNAESEARNNNIGIWAPSPEKLCIELISLDYFDKEGESETLILNNLCEKEIEIIIKDDATHIYLEKIKPGLFKKTFNNIFNDDSDSLYIWDKNGKLIIFSRYP